MKTALRIEDLSFRYPAYPGLPSAALFSGLDLELPEGGICLLLGKAESGKSTLCRILMGLAPRFTGGELSGRIRLHDRPIERRPPFDLLQEIGLVFQNPSEQLFCASCESEVAFALESLGQARAEMRRRVAAALKWMGLRQFRDRNPATLSGGEKKKLALACLEAVDPRVWLLDETFEELDAGTKLALLQRLREKRKTVLILSARWYELFGDFLTRSFLLSAGAVLPVPARPGTRAFTSFLRRNGFLLARRTAPPAHPSRMAIEAEALRFRYDNESSFCLSVDHFHVSRGDLLAVVGDNGSGKTTLAKLLCGLLEPQQGRIRIPGRGGYTAADTRALNAYCAYIFQDPDLQIFLPTAEEELAYGLELQGRAEEEVALQVSLAARLFRLPAPRSPPALMSYGGRKRLQAAVYYLLDKPLVIFDEGDSGLEAEDFCRLIDLFRSPERGLMVITHDLALAEHLAASMVRLQDGRAA